MLVLLLFFLVTVFRLNTRLKYQEKTPADGNAKDVEIVVPLRYLSNIWKTLEKPLINSEINLILTWSAISNITSLTGGEKFATTDTKLYVSVVTLSTQDNAKLLQQFK